MTIIKKRPESPFFGDMMLNLFDDRFFSPLHRTIVRNTPSANISEDEQSYIIQVAAPGMTKEAFSIDLNLNTLTISAEKKEEHNEIKDQYTVKEYDYSSFTRSFRIPKNGDANNISATYTDGVLEVKIAKKEPEQNTVKRITVG